jgi:YHS domain-containing protein
MKRVLYLGVAILALALAGCDGSTPPSEKPGGGGPLGGSRSDLPNIKVASDGVVRDASGDAYCVVMKQSVAKAEEGTYPSTILDGVKYIFCCQTCPKMFEKDQAKYLVAKK